MTATAGVPGSSGGGELAADGLGVGDLVVTGATLGNPPVDELAAVASAAGFAGLSVWPEPFYGRARAEGLSDRDIRAILDDHGVRVHDVDAVIAWAGPDDPGPPYLAEAPVDTVFGAAEALGARLVNVGLVGSPAATVDDCAEAFARICDRAAGSGLGVTLEYYEVAVVSDLPTAAAVVTAAGRPNGAVLLDTWNHHWAGGTVDDLVAVGAPVAGVQMSDAPATRPADLLDATMRGRLAPGDGVIELGAELRALYAGGYRGPLTSETLNEPLLARLGAGPFAEHLAARLREVLASAGPPAATTSGGDR